MNVNYENLSSYFRQLRKIPVMTTEREKEIKELMCSGNLSKQEIKKLRDEVIVGNLRFVVSMAKKYQNLGLDIEDIVMEGNYGLGIAFDKFDWSNFDNKFISYASHWIKQSILDALNKYSRTIRIPTNVIQDYQKAIKSQKSPDEVIKDINLCSSYDNIINEEGDGLIDLLYDKTQDDFKEIFSNSNDKSNRLTEIMEILSEKELYIIKCYHGFNGAPMTLEEIGDDIGLTKERVRQIKEKSLRKLRNNMNSFMNDFAD